MPVFEDELIKVDTLIQKHDPRARKDPYNPTSEEPLKWFRPGVGFWTKQMCDIAEKYGYRTVLGCRFPHDTTSRDPTLNAWHVSQGVHPGAIIVLHDYRERIIETLRILLPDLKGRGYEVVTMSELFRMACVGSEVWLEKQREEMLAAAATSGHSMTDTTHSPFLAESQQVTGSAVNVSTSALQEASSISASGENYESRPSLELVEVSVSSSTFPGMDEPEEAIISTGELAPGSPWTT
jgi:hypothetical protein